ncbi:hypothetical protein GLOIN_2v1879307 [Rhizophagus irregularis DAOM 181602=DAOM 197198]|nr:hypothetical protein GLOIN_2v1879307 [Rhizophagus irregularis DAOM 181602=DAOM 197198]
MTLPTFNIDIIFEIINKLKDDGASLFNFLLLNKQICELTIPILWENPFKFCNIKVESKHYFIIQTYINCFNEDDHKKVISILNSEFENYNENKIPLLFEYGKYLKEFNIRDLSNAVISCVKWNADKFDDLITNILELRANSITKLVLNNLDFSKISFDYILKCINLEVLVLRSNEGLKFEDIDLFTSFNNLKKLDLSFNDWSSEVTTLIIKKAGNNLSSLTIGEEDNKKSINDDTLIALTQYCPNINSLSISGVCKKGFEMIFKYIKNFRLVTLQLYQNKMKGTIMNLEGLLNYMEYEETLSTLGIGINDDYWHYYNYDRDNFKDFLEKHNIRLILYKPRFYY